jgi:hypothetical protein
MDRPYRGWSGSEIITTFRWNFCIYDSGFGTAVERFKDNDIQQLIYTVGNEQDYHFQVLFLVLKS